MARATGRQAGRQAGRQTDKSIRMSPKQCLPYRSTARGGRGRPFRQHANADANAKRKPAPLKQAIFLQEHQPAAPWTARRVFSRRRGIAAEERGRYTTRAAREKKRHKTACRQDTDGQAGQERNDSFTRRTAPPHLHDGAVEPADDLEPAREQQEEVELRDRHREWRRPRHAPPPSRVAVPVAPAPRLLRIGHELRVRDDVVKRGLDEGGRTGRRKEGGGRKPTNEMTSQRGVGPTESSGSAVRRKEPGYCCNHQCITAVREIGSSGNRLGRHSLLNPTQPRSPTATAAATATTAPPPQLGTET